MVRFLIEHKRYTLCIPKHGGCLVTTRYEDEVMAFDTKEEAEKFIQDNGIDDFEPVEHEWV